ncbi:hypothetical protein PACTADRAFT_48561 [Pachysolen tannophilus NRRL Y-2460]|uniref:ATP synthase assembly factor FMC1, mitochondrial n=1 Tax=Pachysolen tannophilus NRRL Y-2460 TaxID=669874 RepID=A0A1E4TYC5_PACTA|nr:hypothetical protein PACTADRAFT_48561 [Pachysolen tannophilus NRRL Y-2460]
MSSKTIKLLAENLQKELHTLNQNSFKVHQKDLQKKNEAMLAYKKLQLLRAGKTLDNETASVLAKKYSTTELKLPAVDMSFVDHIVEKKGAHNRLDHHHLDTMIVFLSSQRVYHELLERYNPGLTASKDNHVKKTANRVGLEIPE